MIASIAQALDYEQKAATDWLKQFRQDVTEAAKRGTVESYGGLRNSISFDWFNQNNYPPYTRRMRTNFKQMLVTPQFYLFRYEQGNGELERAFDVAQRLSNVTTLLTLKDDVKPSSNDMLIQARLVINQVAEIMKETNNPRELSDALEAFADILQHAEERDWVAIGLDISDRLREREVSVKYQRSLQFSRTLLSMYQAESKEDAKAILQSTLENASSREQRFDQKTYDMTALVGARIGSVRQEWAQNASSDHVNSTNFGYGIFAPFGLQIAKKCVGFMIYPVDLGAYLSGSNADQTATIRVQSALHSGLALYKRFSAKTPTVLGISADYKPRFGTDDSQEIRASIFFAIELPMYIIQ